MKLSIASYWYIFLEILLIAAGASTQASLLIDHQLESSIGGLQQKKYLELLEQSIRNRHSRHKLQKLASVSSTSVGDSDTGESQAAPDPLPYIDPENVNGVPNRVRRAEENDDLMGILAQSSGFGSSEEAVPAKISKVDFYLKLKGLAHFLHVLTPENPNLIFQFLKSICSGENENGPLCATVREQFTNLVRANLNNSGFDFLRKFARICQDERSNRPSCRNYRASRNNPSQRPVRARYSRDNGEPDQPAGPGRSAVLRVPTRPAAPARGEPRAEPFGPERE